MFQLEEALDGPGPFQIKFLNSYYDIKLSVTNDCLNDQVNINIPNIITFLSM